MRVDEFADGLRARLRGFEEVLSRRERRDRRLRGLTGTQVRVLQVLLHHEQLASGHLSREMDLAPSTVTRVCDVLVERGLVARKPADDDRRKVVLGLTPAGFRSAREMDRWEAAAVDQVASEIERGRREALLENLDLLIDALGAQVPRRGRPRRRRR
jgi:DNA-binding MarR family transcriptional regulator